MSTLIALWWIRRDMRLADNQALTAALNYGAVVIPVFILDPRLLDSPYNSAKRTAFLLAGLRQLAADLELRGSHLIVRQGHPPAELQRLLAETGATRIFAEADFSPYARRRDQAVAAALPLELTPGLTVFPPDAVRKKDNTPYTVFTPYSRSWLFKQRFLAADLLPAPDRLAPPPPIPGLPIPAAPVLPDSVPFPAGEAEAHRRLADFIRNGLDDYARHRDQMGLAGTSGLSPYARFGMISARQMAVAVQDMIEAEITGFDGPFAWLNELIWREFYQMLLFHFPQALRAGFKPQFQQFPWANNQADFAAWCAGQTGYPVVDAAMRQLAQSGWMHNRARMIVASFLTKHLLIDWRWGERFFMQHLLDGDPASNNGGWQWSAGCGADAAPYFRVFNPVLQSQKFDPAGTYIRRWVSELARVPDKFIHSPWQMSPDEQRRSGCLIGADYPPPRVDHAWARTRALEALAQLKNR